MSIITTYPTTTPKLNDLLLGTEIKQGGNTTKNFSVSDILSLVTQGVFVGLPIYANNIEAEAAGLLTGDIYRTSSGVLMVVFHPQ